MSEALICTSLLLVFAIIGSWVNWNPTPYLMWDSWRRHKKDMGLE